MLTNEGPSCFRLQCFSILDSCLAFPGKPKTILSKSCTLGVYGLYSLYDRLLKRAWGPRTASPESEAFARLEYALHHVRADRTASVLVRIKLEEP